MEALEKWNQQVSKMEDRPCLESTSPSTYTEGGLYEQQSNTCLSPVTASHCPPGQRCSDSVMCSLEPDFSQPALTSKYGIDLASSPSVVKVIEEDRALWGKQAFVTNTCGQLPPLASTEFTVDDQGNSSPHFVRCTTYTLPTSAELANISHFPLGVLLKPLGTVLPSEGPIPLVDMEGTDPVQCSTCSAYVCPFMQFVEAGQRFCCPFCYSLSDVPWRYYQHTDRMGKRVDHHRRAELTRGTYEFLTEEHPNKVTVTPAFIFLIDVSQNAVRHGVVHQVCEELKHLMSSPGQMGAENCHFKVGFMTYNTTVHFYNLSSSLSQPHMLVLTDVSELQVPLLDGLLVSIHDSRSNIESLLVQIPSLFAEQEKEEETVFGTAVKAGLEAVKICGCPGRLFLFHTSVLTADRKLSSWNIGAYKYKSPFQPQVAFYQDLAQDCVSHGCCVDLFLFPNSKGIDITSAGFISLATGGRFYKYNNFQANLNAAQFATDLNRALQTEMGFSVEVTLLTSKELKVKAMYGVVVESKSNKVKLAGMDSNKTFAVELEHSGILKEEHGAFIQCALSYTNFSGQKRIRVHNISLNCSSQLVDTFRQSQAETLITFLSKAAFSALPDSPTKSIRDGLVDQVTHILACYRKNCATSLVSEGQLVLPQFLKVFPVYANCLRKSDVLLPGDDASIDERAYIQQILLSMDPAETAVFLYPCILPLHIMTDNAECFPNAVRCSSVMLSTNGIYLAENGLILVLWIGANAPHELIQSLLDVPAFSAIWCGEYSLPVLNTPFSQKVRKIVEKIQNQRTRFLKLFVVKQGDTKEKLFQSLLVEDKTPNGGASYLDFLYHVHISVLRLQK
ncbi:protein transport protein Sec24C-like [Protopterus annectens]|uniref:protein transport protein Sec24C-like n=1 Tax=Protopterus annectens TaxID=7888 RepID=UPI001CFC055C|nr:protein transport protein Sec24C-like [Protopterus annectens]